MLQSGLLQILFEDHPGIVVAHAVATPAIEQIFFLGVVLLQPVGQRLAGILADAHGPALAVFLTFIDQNLLIGEMHIAQLGVEQLADTHPGSKQQ